jgi:hypothetical protein
MLTCRLLAQAMCLTGSDLNSSAKPWDIQYKVSKNVYTEFHDQVWQETLIEFAL